MHKKRFAMNKNYFIHKHFLWVGSLKGLSHEKLFRHISCKNASGIRWAWWKVWKSWFSTLILAFISKSSQLMALKNTSVSTTCHWVIGRMSTTCHWDKGRMSTICHSKSESVHNLSLKQRECPKLVTENMRLPNMRSINRFQVFQLFVANT